MSSLTFLLRNRRRFGHVANGHGMRRTRTRRCSWPWRRLRLRRRRVALLRDVLLRVRHPHESDHTTKTTRRTGTMRRRTDTRTTMMTMLMMMMVMMMERTNKRTTTTMIRLRSVGHRAVRASLLPQQRHGPRRRPPESPKRRARRNCADETEIVLLLYRTMYLLSLWLTRTLFCSSFSTASVYFGRQTVLLFIGRGVGEDGLLVILDTRETMLKIGASKGNRLRIGLELQRGVQPIVFMLNKRNARP